MSCPLLCPWQSSDARARAASFFGPRILRGRLPPATSRQHQGDLTSSSSSACRRRCQVDEVEPGSIVQHLAASSFCLRWEALSVLHPGIHHVPNPYLRRPFIADWHELVPGWLGMFTGGVKAA